MPRSSRLAVAIALAATLAACSHGGGRRAGRNGAPPAAKVAPTRVTQIGVNAYLWRATLDTLSFMAIHQTDSNGGVIVTEWYVNPAVPTERMKVSVSILDQDLRADALRVTAARQILQGGQWTDTVVQAATDQRLEEIILQRARDLRRNAAGI